MLYDDFNAALAAGRKGEILVAAVLEKLGYTVTDLSNDKEYQSKDIDLIAAKDEEQLNIEVKTDAAVAKTGNLVLETMTNCRENKKGWFYYTEASHIFFVDINNKVIHAVRTAELRDLYRSKGNAFPHRICSNYECNKFYKESEIALVPLSEIQRLPHYNKIGEILQ